MSNWMGVPGATRASSESTESAGDGSEPTELMLPARVARPLLEKGGEVVMVRVMEGLEPS